MNSSKKNKASILEMIFENKNKSYGAYALRTSYDNTMAKAVFATSSILVIFVVGFYLFKADVAQKSLILDDPNIAVNVQDRLIEIDITPEKPQAPKSPQKPAQQTTIATLIKDAAIENDKKVTNANMDPKNVDGDKKPATDIGTDKPCVDCKPKVEPTVEPETEPVLIPDVMPSFVGGYNKMVEFLSRNLIYPENAKTLGIEGTVYINFIVDEEGNVKNVKVLKNLGTGCDEEAVRVIKKMPKWNPGIKDGKKVKVIFNIPIKFILR